MGSAVIFSGNDVKTLKSNIDLNGNSKVLSGSVDPTSSATSAPVGSLYLNNSNGRLYRKLDSGSSTNWVAVSSGSSGINYITNPDAEANVTGWNTYADAAGSSPVDGTGGSPNVTITRTTSTPLRGTGSLLLTKDAANRQGQGVSTDFTIDSADQAKVINVSFDYAIASGTFVSGDSSDVRVFLYDVTNAVLVPVTPFTIQGGSTGSFKFTGVFQTASNSTSYRLILHIATTSASAYTFKFDNVVVGPQIVEYGSAVTDWVAFTPTGSWVTNTTYTGYWRRVGDSMDIIWRVALSGAPTATSLTLNLPSGYSIDTTKITGGANRPIFGLSRIASGGNSLEGTIVYESTTSVRCFYAVTNTGTNPQPAMEANFSSSAPFTAASPDNSLFYASGIPILGWSSTVLMSNDTDTRVVSAVYSLSANSARTSGQTVIFDTKTFDTHGAFSTSTGLFTCPVSGYYRITGFSLTTSGTGVDLVVAKNGTQVKPLFTWTSTGNYFNGSAVIQVVAGDTLSLQVDGSVTVGGGAGIGAATLFIERLTGPSAIAATEKVYAVYKTSATTSMTSGTEYYMDWTTKIVDSHGAVLGNGSGNVTTTNTGWRFIAPRAGLYYIEMGQDINSATGFNGTSEAIYSLLVVNNVQVKRLSEKIPGSAEGFPTIEGAAAWYLNAGDRVEIQTAQLSGGALSMQSNSNSTISISSQG